MKNFKIKTRTIKSLIEKEIPSIYVNEFLFPENVTVLPR